MIKDFDYVTMDDYSRDMKESSDRASSIIKRQAKEIRELKEKLLIHIAALVYSSGGEIKIYDNALLVSKELELLSYRDDSDNSQVFKTKRK